MIVKIDSRAYDTEGMPTSLPTKRSLHFHPTFAMATYLTRRGDSDCRTLEEIRTFLDGCTYVSDRRQFGVDDYWMRPDQFERNRRGDCEDFALWTWCQLVRLGFDVRFVIGTAGFSRNGHAWVTFRKDGEDFLLEPLASKRRRITRLGALMHYPRVSVAWDGDRLRYFEHKEREFSPSILDIIGILLEWLPRVLWTMLVSLAMLPKTLWRLARRKTESQ